MVLAYVTSNVCELDFRAIDILPQARKRDLYFAEALKYIEKVPFACIDYTRGRCVGQLQPAVGITFLRTLVKSTQGNPPNISSSIALAVPLLVDSN